MNAPQDLSKLAAVGQATPEQPLPLPDELPPVDPFPLQALPETFRPWVADVSDRMQCPPDYVGVPMLVGAASLVARHVGIRPLGQDDWFERGNLWALIVGRPGQMKSPAMAQALAPLERLEAKAADEFSSATSQHQAEKLAAKLRADAAVDEARKKLKQDKSADVTGLLAAQQLDEAPARRRYIVSDLTYESLGEILAANPSGVLSVRDEMRGLFLTLAREESAPARAFYLQAWSGGTYRFDRIGRGSVTIPDARLSMIGCIQPGPLSDLAQQARRGAANDGMLERFLISWPDAPGQWREVDRRPDSNAKRLAWETFERLDRLTEDAIGAEIDTNAFGEQHGLGSLRLSPDAREAFSEWRGELERVTLPTADNEGLEAALSKFRHQVPALALAIHVADGGYGPVSLKATVSALCLAEYFETHARRLHSSGRRMTVKAAKLILSKVNSGALAAVFTAREVYRNQWSGLADKTSVADALDMLVAHGWLHEAEVNNGGRPTLVYSLTPGGRRG